MSDKEKLVELIAKAKRSMWGKSGLSSELARNVYLAEHLIANGVRLEEKQATSDGWIPVTERLPENEVDVLILAERRLYGIGKVDRKTVRLVAAAFHTDGKMNTEESGYNWELDNVDMEYDEDADAFIVPEGWWEAVRYGEEFSAVDDFVTHWRPLPEPPKGE